MGKIIFLLAISFLITGCALINNPILGSAKPEPSRTIRNEHCLESPYLRVLQILDHGIIAYLCPVDIEYPYKNVFDSCQIRGDLVYMSVPDKENDFVDDQKLTLPDDVCFTSSGTYRYYNKEKDRKTIRRITLLESQMPNPNYKKVKAN